MPEELSPESKLYIKEEIEKVRKDIKEEIEKVKSKVTKTFATIAMIVGLLTGMGVYGFAKEYMKTTIQTTVDNKLGEQALEEFKQRMIKAQGYVENANKMCDEIAIYEKEANNIVSKLESYKFKVEGSKDNGYACIGDITFVWGNRKSRTRGNERYELGNGFFRTECIAVIPSLAGTVRRFKNYFTFDCVDDYGKGDIPFTFLAIGY